MVNPKTRDYISGSVVRLEVYGPSNYEYYTPEVCDGNFCPKDCDICQLKEKVLEMQEEVNE